MRTVKGLFTILHDRPQSIVIGRQENLNLSRARPLLRAVCDLSVAHIGVLPVKRIPLAPLFDPTPSVDAARYIQGGVGSMFAVAGKLQPGDYPVPSRRRGLPWQRFSDHCEYIVSPREALLRML